jgi:hypothetical protein
VAIFRGRRSDIELTRETASQRRLFQKETFWGALMARLQAEPPGYLHYSYSSRADVYRGRVSPDLLKELPALGNLLKYRNISQQIEFLEPQAIELLVPRQSGEK